jgi:hypothetical protein
VLTDSSVCECASRYPSPWPIGSLIPRERRRLTTARTALAQDLDVWQSGIAWMIFGQFVNV